MRADSEAESWINVSTPHFELYTTNSAAQAADALSSLEQIHAFFAAATASRHMPEIPIRVIAFRSDSEFAPYRLKSGAIAYYQHVRRRDYIVLQDLKPGHDRTAFHEFAHLMVNRAGLPLPLWLDEGLAELYSTVETRGGRVSIGRPLAGYLAFLGSHDSIDLSVLTHVNSNSAYYNQREKSALFYAESWALTHMLALSPTYARKFPQFVAAVSRGDTAEEAFRSIYHRTRRQIEGDLHRYTRQGALSASVLNLDLHRQALTFHVCPLSRFESDIALADLLASHRDSASEAHSRLNQLSILYPDNPKVDASLGYLAWEEGRFGDACPHFLAAVRKGSRDPAMLYDYAMLLAERAGDRFVRIALLRKALVLSPDFSEASLALDREEAAAPQYQSAFSNPVELRNVPSVPAAEIVPAGI